MRENNKRVLLIGAYPPPFGGIASHLQNFIPELQRKGYSVCVISRSKKDEFIQTDGLSVHRVNLTNKFYLLFNFKMIISNLKCFMMLKRQRLSLKEILSEMVFKDIINKAITKYEIGLISFYDMANSYSIPVLKKILNLRIPMVLTIYANIYESPHYFQSRSRLIKSMLEESDMVLASSKYSARSVELLNLDSSKIEPVYYGIDLRNFSPSVNSGKIKDEFKLDSNTRVMLFVGRMNREMGLDVILDIIPKVLSQRNDAVFFIVGARGELIGKTEQLQLRFKNSVYIITDVPFDKLPYYYAACDILLAPTRGRHASMGMSIKEAMATGKPVITVDSPGIREAVINGETGLLVQTDENLNIQKDLFCDAIFRMLDSQQMRNSMGLSARKRAQDLFNKNTTSRKMISIFESLSEKQT